MRRMSLAVLLTGSIVGCSNIITAPSEIYYCDERDHQVRMYIATNNISDTVMFQTLEGEVLYLDWMGKAYHVSGPECKQTRVEQTGY